MKRSHWLLIGGFTLLTGVVSGQVFRNKNDPSLDTTPPVVAIAVPTASSTYDNGTGATLTTLSGTATDAAGITICQWSNAQGSSGNATTSANGNWTVSNIALAVGSNVLTVTCQDAFNNPGSAPTLTVTRSSSCSGSGPTVCGVSGTLTNGSTLTITGANFGATGPTVQIFDNFDVGTNGGAIAGHSATVGAWDSGSQAQVPRYYNGDAVSGTQSMRVDTATDPTGGTGLATSGFSTSDIFWASWVKIPSGQHCPGNGNGTNWKMFWPSHAPCCDTNDLAYPGSGTESGSSCNNWQMFGNNQPDPGTWGYWDGVNGGCGSSGYHPCTSHDWNLNFGTWYRIAVYVHGDTTTATSNNQAWVMSTSEGKAYTNHYNTNHRNFGTAAAPLTEWIINGFTRQTTSGTSTPLYDDAYVAVSSTIGGAQARVEFSNATTYAASTNLSMCTTTAWSATSITCTLRQGSFSSGTVYVYVHDLTGAVNSAGFAVSLQ